MSGFEAKTAMCNERLATVARHSLHGGAEVRREHQARAELTLVEEDAQWRLSH